MAIKAAIGELEARGSPRPTGLDDPSQLRATVMRTA